MGFKNFGKGVRRAVVGLAAAFAVCASTPETPGTPTTPGESSNNGTTAPGPKEQAKKQTPRPATPPSRPSSRALVSRSPLSLPPASRCAPAAGTEGGNDQAREV